MCLLFSWWTYSQDPAYWTLDTENGLPSKTIYDIQQLENGRIVVGHERGLSSYNGMEVINFQNKSKTTPLSNIVVYGNNVICRNFYSEVYKSADDEQLELLENLSMNNIGICQMMYCENRWFKRTNNEVHEFDLKRGGTIKKLLYRNESSLFDFKCMDGVMSVLSSDKIEQFGINTQSKKSTYRLTTGKGARLFILDKKLALFCPEYGFIQVDPCSSNTYRIYLKGYNSNDKSTAICQLSDGNLYLGTFGGLYIFNRKGELIQLCYREVQISCIFEDLESNVWLGTIHDGIRIVPDFSIQTLVLDRNERIGKIQVLDTENLLIGTFSGKLMCINSSGKQQILYDFKQNSEIQSIFVESDKSIWTFCTYLLHFGKSIPAQKYASLPVKCLVKYDGKLFCGTSRGLQIVDEEGEIRVIHSELWIKSSSIYRNKLIFETSRGLMIFENGALVPLHVNDQSKKLDLSNAANLISFNGAIYFSIGTCVYMADKRGNVELFDCVNELTFVTKIAANGTSLFATDGRRIIQIKNKQMRVINEAMGLHIQEITDLKCWNNKLVVAGINQLQMLPIDLGKTRITQKLNLQKLAGTYHFSNGRYVSSFDGNRLIASFDFLPNISARGTGSVYYRLKGVANDWKKMEYVSGGFRIDERRLPHGTFNLEVYGDDGFGNKTHILSFPIRTYPPIYLTWWFILAAALTVILLSWQIYKRRIIAINRKNRVRMEQEQLKTKVISSELKALRSQMNPHFIFNSLSSIQSKILNDQAKDAYTNLSSFSKLLRQSLKFTSQEFISLENEIDFIKNYISLEQARMENGFEASVQIESTIDISEALFPSLFSQPFVENAIRHGLSHSKNKKELKISVVGTNSNFTFIVDDNGIGRKAANEINLNKAIGHESFATQAMEDRIQMINSNGTIRVNLDIEDKLTGTRVKINIRKSDERG